MTSLLSALRNEMIPGNAAGSESDLRAQIETLRVERDALKLEIAQKLQPQIDDFTAQEKLWRRVPVAAEWGECGFSLPFSAVKRAGPPFGEVYDDDGLLLARCGRHQVAVIIAALLNEAAQRMKQP